MKEKIVKTEKIKQEPSDDDVFVGSKTRQASIKAAAKNHALLGTGGYFDSQTRDTQLFGPLNDEPTFLSPPRKRGKFKPTMSPSPLQKKNTLQAIHDDDNQDVKNPPPPIYDDDNQDVNGTDTADIVPEKLGFLYEVGDDELERKLEEAMCELGRLRIQADAKVTEINVLLSHRLARMRHILRASRNTKGMLESVSDSPLQGSQTWEEHGHLADDPYYPSLESQIYHTIVKDYEPVGSVPPSWLS